MAPGINIKTNKSQHVLEAILILTSTISMYFIASYFQFAESWQEWAQHKEKYQFDELVFVFLTFSICLILFTYRRYKDLETSLKHNIVISNRLENKNTEISTLLNQNRELINHITQAREMERNQLANDLHDVFGQHLAAIDVNLAVAIKYSKDDDKLNPILNTIQTSASHLINVTRSQLHSIKQPSLKSVGLSASIESFVSQWLVSFPSYQLSISTHVEDSWVDYDTGLSIYRCIQESLSNIVKHAKASAIIISVRTHKNKVANESGEKEIVLIIQDDGVGLTSGKKPASGFGIIGMRERISALSGEFFIEPCEPTGTKIQIKIPL
jgi:two-component system sensor histidine kinase UhpB